MSPNPTEGFYSVIHFSTDGSAVHLTVGCGSSRFHKGSSVVLPDEDLDRQTSWARRVIVERFSTLDPFSDLPDFGARRRLPLSFQRATVVSKRVPYNDIDTFDFERFLVLAAGRLRAVYDAQATGRDIDEADQVEAEVSTAINPTRFVGLRQGIGLPAAAKRAVERRAMELAEAWLVREGYTVIDCSARQPFDFQAVKGEDRIKVEVKGTTSDFASAVLMTRAEVDLHRAERGSTALIIASRIKLAEDGGSYTADGGEVDAMVGWNISDWELEPTSYRVTRPTR